MEERTIARLPIGDTDAMHRWYKRHALFCIEHNMICFEMACQETTGKFPAFMLQSYTRASVGNRKI